MMLPNANNSKIFFLLNVRCFLIITVSQSLTNIKNRPFSYFRETGKFQESATFCYGFECVRWLANTF